MKKIRKLICILSEHIAYYFELMNKSDLFEGGGGVCMSLMSKSPILAVRVGTNNYKTV